MKGRCFRPGPSWVPRSGRGNPNEWDRGGPGGGGACRESGISRLTDLSFQVVPPSLAVPLSNHHRGTTGAGHQVALLVTLDAIAAVLARAFPTCPTMVIPGNMYAHRDGHIAPRADRDDPWGSVRRLGGHAGGVPPLRAPSTILVLVRGAIPKTVGVLEEGGLGIAPPIITSPAPKVDHGRRAGIPVPHPCMPYPSTPLKEANVLGAHPKV